MNPAFTAREQVVEVVNRLFYYTDERAWEKLQKEVFAPQVLLDMVSVGAEKAETYTSRQICDMWEEGFSGLDAIHHQAGNYIVDLHDNSAEVIAYSIASHYKRAATEGSIREFVGSYNFHLVRTGEGWRIDRFKYNLKYLTGNINLK